ncbi:unnamed protein product [Menidia menidia]|uniref:(Atlantic silverside) hypothetical protein n=1 Tax=Menidia menidia TaxID=238744 RepID=A0A8S4AHW9_9TELE|nr:unnamed protein product [Menidia menidia]
MEPYKFCQSPCRQRDLNEEWRQTPAQVLPHKETNNQGATSAWINRYQQSFEGSLSNPAGVVQIHAREGSSSWSCEQDREDEYNSQSQSEVEEELEAPLPLKADDEWHHQSNFALPHNYMRSYNIRPWQMKSDAGYYCSTEQRQYNLSPENNYPPQAYHHAIASYHNWNDSENRLQLHDRPLADVLVNVPLFATPPEQNVSGLTVMKLSTEAAEEPLSHRGEKRRTISFPDECRNVFITYSLDTSSEVAEFADFLTKHGFQPATDFDNPNGCVDINKRRDSYLKDPSILIIIAISPKYKDDIEGSVVDSHGLHTKYIHSMMQNEFIQQGSLNFRFIPVLFPSATQRHVPTWLQNTQIYRWPQDTEDLLLRLQRKEKYIPPPVPEDLTLIIRPMTISAASIL